MATPCGVSVALHSTAAFRSDTTASSTFLPARRRATLTTGFASDAPIQKIGLLLVVIILVLTRKAATPSS
jgi:hypothetical protein